MVLNMSSIIITITSLNQNTIPKKVSNRIIISLLFSVGYILITNIINQSYLNFIIPVRPYWSEWSGWQNGVCSRTCGEGSMNQQRRRQCSHGANACVGHADESRQSSCNSHPCPGKSNQRLFA